MAEEVNVNAALVDAGAATAEEAALVASLLEKHGFSVLLQRFISVYERKVQHLCLTVDEAKSERERLVLTSETKFHQLEKDLTVTLQRLDVAQRENNKLNHELSLKVTESTHLQKTLEATETARDTSALQQRESHIIQQKLESEKQELLETLDRRNTEITRLNEEWHRMSERVTTASKLHGEVQVKVDEIQSREITFQFREQRLQQEKDLLDSQNKWLQTELKNKAETLVQLKNEYASDRVSLRSELSDKSQQLTRLESLVEEMKQTMKGKDAKLEVYLDKLKQAREEKLQCEEHFRKELSAQTKLSTLYQTSATESEKRVEELITAVEELQQLYGKSVEEQKEVEVLHYTSAARVNELNEMVNKLKGELEDANELLELARQRGVASMSEDALKELCPTAATTSSLLKSGMTLTQIYSEYVETSDALRQEKEENKRLNDYLNEILRELEEKAPVLQQQKREFEETLKMNEHLSLRLSDTMNECERRSDETEQAIQETNFLKRENRRLREQTADLGQQVRVLLKECEEARGGLSSTCDPLLHRDEGSNVSSSSQVISSTLVAFRSIQELQQQNQKLLSVVRELSEEKEQAEQAQADARITELQQQLQVASSQLDELRQARARQSEMVEAIVRQRDMYRVLAQGSSPAKLSTSLNASDVVAVGGLESDEVAEARGALKELQSEFESYKKEKAEYSRMIETKLEEFRDEASKVKLENSRLSSSLEFAGERAQMQLSNTDGYRREVDSLRDRNQKLSESQLKLEMNLEKARQELLKTTEAVGKLERSCEMLKLERDQLKTAESRLLQLNDGLMREKQSQNVVIANLQTLEKNLERSELEVKTRLGSKIEDLEREVVTLRRESTAEREKHDDMLHLVQTQLRETQSRLEQERKQVSLVKEQLVASQSNIAAMERTENELKERLQKSEQQLEQLTGSSADETDEQKQLSELRAQIRSLQEQKEAVDQQLSQAIKRADEFKALSLANEEALQESNHAHSDFQKSMEARLAAAIASEEKTKEKLADVEKRREKLMQDHEKLQKHMHEQTQDLRRSVLRLQTDLEDAVAARTGAEQGELIAQTECRQQARKAAEAQEKYERELTLHSADVQSLQSVKAKLKKVYDQLDEARIASDDASARVRQIEAVMEEKTRASREESSQLTTRMDDLQKQNEILHEQAERLSRQLVAAQPSLSDALSGFLSGDSSSQTEDNHSKTPAQLWDIIRFLRREKQIAETKCEVSGAESVRYRQQYEHLQRQLEDTRTALTEERERSQLTAQTAAQHAEIMEKVENLSILQDSNKVLREEKTYLSQQVAQLEAKVKWLEGEMGPLSENNRLLSGQKEKLLAEKAALKNEVDRWMARTNHLIEECNRVDPEEYKALIEHRQHSETKITTITESLQQSQEEVAALQAESNHLKDQNAESTKSYQELQKELETVKQNVEAKTREIAEKTKMVTKLRNVGRNYRTNFEQTKAELEETKKKLEDALKQEGEKSGSQDDFKAEMEEKVKSLSQEIEQLKKDNQEQQLAIAERDEKVKRHQQLLKRTQERMRTLTNENMKLAAESKAATKETAGTEKEKHADDEREMREVLLKQQLEQKIKRLQQEKQEVADKSKEWQDKYAKLLKTMQEKRETLQKAQKPAVSVAAPSVVSQVGVSVLTTTPLVTASVVPTPAMLQATPTATVKPMPASGTRTVAVAPTAVAATSDVSSGLSQETPANVENVAEVSSEHNVTLSVEAMDQESEEPEAGDQLEEGEIPRSASRDASRAHSPTSVQPASSGKRPREEAQSSGSSVGSAGKRVKMSEDILEASELSHIETASTETSQTSAEQSQHIEISSSGQIEDSTERSHDDAGDELVERAAHYSHSEEMQEGTVTQGENEEPHASAEAWTEDVSEQGPLPETTESGQTGSGESDNEMAAEEQLPISGSDVTVTEPQTSQSSDQMSNVGESSQASSSLQPPMAPVSHSKSRLELARSELPRFSFGQPHPAPSSGIHYDESEDSTVPHTPVLHPPGRSDFAQMIASPMVNTQPRFPQSQQLVDPGRDSLGAIATQSGLRMDDTQIDLLGSGRSSLHLHVSRQQPEDEHVHTSIDHSIGDSEGQQQSEQLGLEADSVMTVGEEVESEHMTSEVHLAPAETSLPARDHFVHEDDVIDLTDNTGDQFGVGESSSAVAAWIDESSEPGESYLTAEQANDQVVETASESDVIELSGDEASELTRRREEGRETEEGDDDESQSHTTAQEASSSGSTDDTLTRVQSSGTRSGRRINIVRSTQPGRSGRSSGKPKSGD